MPLYDILNEFQKGHSHMAVVVKQNHPTEQLQVKNADVGKFLMNYPILASFLSGICLNVSISSNL